MYLPDTCPESPRVPVGMHSLGLHARPTDTEAVEVGRSAYFHKKQRLRGGGSFKLLPILEAFDIPSGNATAGIQTCDF